MSLIYVFCFIFLSSGVQASDFQARFEPSEHVLAGDDVTLHDVGTHLHLENGLEMSFGELVAMGDFYGIIDVPISEGEDKTDRKNRFLEAFNSLANKPESLIEAPKIVSAIHQRKETQLERIQDWSCLTGGGCNVLTWWSFTGRYILLAEKNYDHFGDDALTTYITGHEVALEKAVSGSLEQAYAMDAFACHYLTDHFSSGHIRTPRVYLAEHVTPASVGSLLAGMMHNEENQYGLHVHNEQGDQWVAYGDGHYLDASNRDNRRIMRQALQNSADEIYTAYQRGQTPSDYAALKLVPEVNEHDSAGHIDLAPLFYWDSENQKLMRRTSLSNPFEYQWTSNWIGWSTLAELQLLKGSSHL
ncbi:MAG: hypothetical protein WCK49_09045 [Myxococcaceae bacterium]